MVFILFYIYLCNIFTFCVIFARLPFLALVPVFCSGYILSAAAGARTHEYREYIYFPPPSTHIRKKKEYIENKFINTFSLSILHTCIVVLCTLLCWSSLIYFCLFCCTFSYFCLFSDKKKIYGYILYTLF